MQDKAVKLSAARIWWHGLALCEDLGDRCGSSVGRTQFQAQHGQRAGSGYGKNFGDRDLSKMRDAQNVAILFESRQIRFDFVHQRAKRDPLICRDYSPGFRIACNHFPQILEYRTLQEQIVAKRDLNGVTGDAKIIKLAADGNDVSFPFSALSLGSEPGDNAVGRNEIQNV